MPALTVNKAIIYFFGLILSSLFDLLLGLILIFNYAFLLHQLCENMMTYLDTF